MNINKIQRYDNKSKYKDFSCKNLNAELPVSGDMGILSISLTQDRLTTPVDDAFLTITVNSEDGETVILRTEMLENPTVIELPIAHPEGNLVRGMEYYFTPYNIEIEKEDYYKVITRNIRLFPNISALFYYNLNRILPGTPNHDIITEIPPHPRDNG